MKFITLMSVGFILASMCMSAQAETDYVAMPVIRDIQKGEQNNNAIVDLYVTDDAQIVGSLAVANLNVTGTTSNSAVAVNGVAIYGYQSDTNETIDVFTIVPAGVSQLLWGTASNEWYISHGATTNDWDHLN